MTYKKKGITVKFFKNAEEGIVFAKETLYKVLTPQSLLFLSGGNTPKPLYSQLAREKKLKVGRVTLVDERYGKPFHKNSNAHLIEESGLLEYFEKKDIPFFSILQSNRHSGDPAGRETPESRSWTSQDDNLKQTTGIYNKKVIDLFKEFSHRVAVMGIGEDAHTAGLPAGISNVPSARLGAGNFQKERLVTKVNNFPGIFKERVSLTFEALSQMDLLIIIVFGENKRWALEHMFTEGSKEEIPARFYTRPEIAQKTLLITDIKI